MKKMVGIIGGMGPLATCDLLEKIVLNTKAEKDQDHVHVVLDNNTEIPDRTKAILGGGQSPVSQLVKSGERLINAGASVLVMHCNTSHYFYDDVASKLSVPLLNMPFETAKMIASAGYRKAGILATDGTRNAGIYEKALAQCGVESVYPDDEGQRALMSAIYDGIKAGCDVPDKEKVYAMLKGVSACGAEVMIIGCTEIPMVLRALPEFATAEFLHRPSGFTIESFTPAQASAQAPATFTFADPTVIIARKLIELSGATPI